MTIEKKRGKGKKLSILIKSNFDQKKGEKKEHFWNITLARFHNKRKWKRD